MGERDPVKVVRRGYDAVSYLYRRDDDNPAQYTPWLVALRRRLPAGAHVLDLGCGCGIPVARALSRDGHHVTGVDLSEIQINRARHLVPQATFRHADATQIALPSAAFDAVVCLFALIHMPLAEQPRLLSRIAPGCDPAGCCWPPPGPRRGPGSEDRWLGGPAPMWWSHAGAATYRDWIVQAGLHIESEAFIPEEDSGHQRFWARRPR